MLSKYLLNILPDQLLNSITKICETLGFVATSERIWKMEVYKTRKRENRKRYTPFSYQGNFDESRLWAKVIT